MKLQWDYTDGVVFPHLYFCSKIANPFSPPGLLPPSRSWLIPLLHETLGLKGPCGERVAERERGNCLLCFLLLLFSLPRDQILSPQFFTHACTQTAEKWDEEKEKQKKRGKEACLWKGGALYREGIALCVSFTGQSLLLYPVWSKPKRRKHAHR